MKIAEPQKATNAAGLMMPSMNPSYPPPFYELDAIAFQEMCRDLFERENGIKVCDIYGTPGQGQRGIDLIAQVQGRYACEVGQCKCYEKFTPGDIREASDEFLAHLEFWKERNVRRFILFVASPLDRTQQQDEIDKQTRRFAELGIEYEAWSSRTLRTKLTSHPDIVFRYTQSSAWVENICGRAPVSDSVGIGVAPGIVDSLLNSQAGLSGGLSEELSRRLDGIREAHNEGRLREAYGSVDELSRNASWQFLSPQLKARVLRTKAVYTLDLDGDTRAARRLIDEARPFDPDGDDLNLHALLSYFEDGTAAALAVVNQPRTVRAFNLKVALLIESGCAREALDELDRVPPGVTPDAETTRLRALALLAEGDARSAREAVQPVLTEHPRWESVRFAAAMIDYYCCLVPDAVPRRIVDWAQPVGWQMVKKDDESRELLRAAEAEFARLTEENERGDERRMVLETWRLACLASDVSRQEEARGCCRSLLERNRTHHRALAWALALGYEVDFSASRAPLEALLRDAKAWNAAELEHVVVLVGMLLRAGEVERARAVLDDWRPEFARTDRENFWRIWQCRMLVAAGTPDQALAVARAERDPTLRRTLMLIALRAESQRTGDHKPHIKYLEKSYRRTKGGEYLFELCLLKAQRGDWKYVDNRADELIEVVGTADAVRLAANAAGSVNRPGRCLKLLNDHQGWFLANRLPGDLLRLRVECEVKNGSLTAALADAQELVRRDESPADRLMLMQAQVRDADIKGAALTARPLLNRDEQISPLELIRAAHWIRLEDRHLASDLWRRGVARLEDQDAAQLSAALQVGFALGMNKEVGPLLGRAQEYAARGEGPLTLATVRDVQAQMRQYAEHLSEVTASYHRGEVPTTFLPSVSRRALADFLHGIPSTNQRAGDPLGQFPVFIRHGGRPVRKDLAEDSSRWRLHLDVSALMLAQHLGVLDAVERVFGLVHVPTSVMSDLVAERDILDRAIPAQLKEHRQASHLAHEGALRTYTLPAEQGDVSESEASDHAHIRSMMGGEWLRLLLHAHVEEGFLVAYLPLRSRTPEREPVCPPEPLGARVTNCRALAEALRNSGRLSASQYEESIEALGTEGVNAPVPETIPALGSKLFLQQSIAGTLARAELLDAVCRGFEVYVSPEYVTTTRENIKEGERLAELAGWVAELHERVRNGSETGVYSRIVLTDEHLRRRREDVDEELEMSMTDLMLHEPSEGDVLWIDDRFANAFPHREGAPIIGISEVLAALRARGELSEQDYHEKLLTLRAGNFRYIPVGASEILYHMAKACISDEEVQETWELATLRRYTAACLFDPNMIQTPPLPEGSPNPHGELAFVMETMRAAEEAIIKLWADETLAVDEAKVKSDWLLKNLYVGSIGVLHLLPNAAARGDAVELLGIDLASTLMKAGLTVGDVTAEESERRDEFIRWFEDRVMYRRLRVDPHARRAAAATLKHHFDDAAQNDYSEEEEWVEPLTRVRMNRLNWMLPDPIADELKLSPEVLEWMGVETVQVVRAGSLSFRVEAYQQAVARAVAGETAAINKVDGDEAEYTFRVTTDSEDGADSRPISIFGKDGKLVGTIRDSVLALLLQDADEQRRILRRHSFWFDCDRQALEAEIEEVVLVPEPRTRVERVNRWRKESAELFYRVLRQNFATQERFLWEDLTPPSATGLLRHYRLPATADEGEAFADVWARSAEALVRDEGLKDALERIACLPIKIPGGVVSELSKLTPDERRRLFDGWSRSWASPVGKLHLIDLIVRTSSDDVAALNLARQLLTELFDADAGAKHFELFGALLDFVSKEFGYWEDAATWSNRTRLAMVWAHACKLHNAYNAVGADLTELAETFRSENRHFPADILARDPAYWSDVLHPRRFSRTVFLTQGVARVLAGAERATLEGTGAIELVRDMTLYNHGGMQMPIPELLRDSDLATNCTGAFLGGEREEAFRPFVGEASQLLASEQLRKLVEEVIEYLEADPNRQGWATIEGVIGDLPAYDGLRSRLASLLLRLDFGAMLKTDVSVGRSALRLAAKQAAHLGDDDLRERVKSGLIELARHHSRNIAESPGEAKDEYTANMKVGELVEIALYLGVRHNDARATSEAFGRTLQHLSTAWAIFGEKIAYAATRLSLELPSYQLHGMWQFLLFLRATQQKSL